jgi:hypothetical protein
MLFVNVIVQLNAFSISNKHSLVRSCKSMSCRSANFAEPLLMSDQKTKGGFEKIGEWIEESNKNSDSKPPIYDPGSFPTRALASLAYIIPIVDASDVGKYMFEAYPDVGAAYNGVFGPLAAVYNGVPFLPFVIYFAMSYICRAPTFPIEVRFHFAQAFMISIIQFVPVLLLGLLEKGGVPGLGIFYNTCKCTYFISCSIY